MRKIACPKVRNWAKIGNHLSAVITIQENVLQKRFVVFFSEAVIEMSINEAL